VGGFDVEGLAVDGLAVVGLAVEGLAVVGLAVVGLAVEGLAVVGAAVVGLAVEGLAVVGLAVDGLAVVGAAVDGLAVVGFILGRFELASNINEHMKREDENMRVPSKHTHNLPEWLKNIKLELYPHFFVYIHCMYCNNCSERY
jgi:hypothetical protein